MMNFDNNIESYLPSTPEYRWHQDPTRSDVYRRLLVAAELFVDFMSYTSDEGSQLLSAIEFQTDPDTISSEQLWQRLQEAWLLTGHLYPTVASRLSSPIDPEAAGRRFVEYRIQPNREAATAWRDSTLFRRFETTADQVRYELSGTKVNGDTDTLLYLIHELTPGRHALLIHAKHPMYDTQSVAWLLSELVRRVSHADETQQHLDQIDDWSKAVVYLPPHHLDPQVWQPENGQVDLDDIHKGLNYIFKQFSQAASHSHGLELPPLAIQHRLSPTESRTDRVIAILEPKTNEKLLTTLKRLGLTLGVACQAAVAIALTQLHPPDPKTISQGWHLQSASLISLRSMLKPPYNQASYQTAVLHSVATCCPLSLCIVPNSSKPITQTVYQISNVLQNQWSFYRSWKGLIPSVHYYDSLIQKQWQQNPPSLSQFIVPQYSSVGKLDSFLTSSTNITINQFFVSLRVTSPIPFLHVWGLNGSTTIQVMYNEFFWEKHQMQKLMDRIVQVLDSIVEEEENE